MSPPTNLSALSAKQGDSLALFFSHCFVGCFESSRQTYVIFYRTGLLAASKAADKSVGCFQSSRKK
jgi:hypothetical protein